MLNKKGTNVSVEKILPLPSYYLNLYVFSTKES